MTLHSTESQTSATYGSTKLHLHQLVEYQYPSDLTKTLIVVSLEETHVELANTEFEYSMQVTRSLMDRVEPLTSTCGAPVFGY